MFFKKQLFFIFLLSSWFAACGFPYNGAKTCSEEGNEKMKETTRIYGTIVDITNESSPSAPSVSIGLKEILLGTDDSAFRPDNDVTVNKYSGFGCTGDDYSPDMNIASYSELKLDGSKKSVTFDRFILDQPELLLTITYSAATAVIEGKVNLDRLEWTVKVAKK